MSNELNYDEHYCPVYDKVIDGDLCYDTLMCLNKSFKISSTIELSLVADISNARKICLECGYSRL